MADAATARPAALRDALAAATAHLGLQTSGRQVEQLLGFVAMLEKWNRTYNLTSIRDAGEMLSLHVVDCLAVVEPLRRQRGPGGIGRVLDVGSGGGLPGVVIAVMDPSSSVTSVDAVGKKTAFVQQVAASLGLHNLRSQHARVEAMPVTPFDVVTSRAFASLRDFVLPTERLLARDGVWMAMKGREPEEEISRLPESVEVFHVEQLGLDQVVGERCIVWMKRRNEIVSTCFADDTERP